MVKHSTILGLSGTLLAVGLLVAGCGGGSGGNAAYALRGTPAAQSGVDSANFLIGNGQCKFVALVGYASNAAVYSYPCTVVSDKPDSLGDPHSHVQIDITAPGGVQHAKIDSTTNGMVANQTPDLGFTFPASWAVAGVAPNITLQNSDAGSTHVTVSVQGVECSVTINSTPVNCGLSYWDDKSVAIWIPGTLVTANYAGSIIGLTFANTSGDQWQLTRAPAGFPANYNQTTSPAPAQ